MQFIKGANIIKHLCHKRPNIGGLFQRNRTLLFSAVVHSKLLFAAAVWTDDRMKMENNKIKK